MGSFVNWEGVAGSWTKRSVTSRLLLFSARRYLDVIGPGYRDAEREAVIEPARLANEIKSAFASPPGAPGTDAASTLWGEFIDAAVAAELEMVSYGERPPLLHELRAGLEQAAEEAGPDTPLGRWFLDRRNALPGSDLPEDPGYLPV